MREEGKGGGRISLLLFRNQLLLFPAQNNVGTRIIGVLVAAFILRIISTG